MRLRLINFGIITASIILLFVECSESDCPEVNDLWELKGKENVGIDTLFYEDTISANDTLYVEIHGNIISGDSFDNVEIEIEQDTNSILIGLYANIYDWKEDGCYIMPPTNLIPHVEIVLPPPFHVGQLKLIAKQTFGLDTLGVITIQP